MTQHSTNTISPKLQALEKKLDYFSQEWVDSNEGETLGSERLKIIKEFLDIYYANPMLTHLQYASNLYKEFKTKINQYITLNSENVKLFNSHGIAFSDWVSKNNIDKAINFGDDLGLVREDLVSRVLDDKAILVVGFLGVGRKNLVSRLSDIEILKKLFATNSKFQKLAFPWYIKYLDKFQEDSQKKILKLCAAEHLLINFKKNHLGLAILKL